MHLRASWTRFKTKLGRQNRPTSPSPTAKPASPVLHQAAASPSSATVASTAEPRNICERLWTEAYDQARAGDQDVVDAYETILSTWISEDSTGVARPQSSAVGISQQNEIPKDAAERRSQMRKLAELGLSRTEKHAKAMQRTGDGMQAALMLKEIVGKAVQASPEAAFAWVGVCFALEICMNPSTEASSNRQGIAYVVSRLDWYWNLSGLLLDENSSKACLQGSRRELERVITQLYTKLLLYQMRSVCYYHRNRFATWMRDLIKLENWSGELGDIQAAELAVQRDSSQYNTIDIRNKLDAIAKTAVSQETKLDIINSAIRKQTLQQETLHERNSDTSCIRDLHTTNPQEDKARIEESKGGLLKDSYCWVLDNAAFQQWHNDTCSQLLWIKGNAGKGKTMLLCGIIDELQKTVGSNASIAYFFCQRTDARINSATAVLRGLLYMLIVPRPELIRHVRERYDHAGGSVFKDVNAWVALTEIFVGVLQDLSLGTTTYILVDGLDECSVDCLMLLQFIAKQASAFPGVKWIVSSRPSLDIEQQLEQAGRKLSLELNAESVTAAVEIYTKQRVDQLAQEKGYSEELRSAVFETMRSKAEGTFLWVALACQSLRETQRWRVREMIKEIPPELNNLYRHMLDQIKGSGDADICLQILATSTVLYRPVTVSELVTLMEFPKAFEGDLKSVREIIGLCGSFLFLQDDKVRFVHQSANDFLIEKASNSIFISAKEEVNHVIYLRSLEAVHDTLHRNMYSLDSPGFPVEDIQRPDPDPLRAIRYSCDYWIDHLCDSDPGSSTHHQADLREGGSLDSFLRKKYLNWLEALGLCESMSRGVLSMAKLEGLFKGSTSIHSVSELARDARRFMMSHKVAIAEAPLQAYNSALVFSPKHSLIREIFEKEAPSWFEMHPGVEEEWGPCLQTLEGHTHWVWSVVFSRDSTQLASGSEDNTVKIWKTSNGDCLRTLVGHDGPVYSVAFSHDSESAQLASASEDHTVKTWSASSGHCLRTLVGHDGPVKGVAFSHDSARLASASTDDTVKIWNSSGDCLHTLVGHSDTVNGVAFSHDSATLASASTDNTVKIWNSSGDCLRTLVGHDGPVRGVAFSHDSTLLASASTDDTVKIWNSGGDCLRTLTGHKDSATGVAFSHDSKQLASASEDNTIRIWDTGSGDCRQVIQGHGYWVNSAVFSNNSTSIASSSHDFSVKIWDASSSGALQMSDGHSNWVNETAFSCDATRLASAADDGTVKVWDVSSGSCLWTFRAHSDWATSVAFSHDSSWLASASRDKTVKIWDLGSGECLKTLEGHSCPVSFVAFSHDSTQLASGSGDKTVKIWDADSGDCLHTLEGHSEWVRSATFIHDSTAQLASTSDDNTLKVWDVRRGECLLTLDTGITLRDISWDIDGPCIRTEAGDIFIGASPITKNATAETKPCDFQHRHKEPSVDGGWITLNHKRLMWLPSGYHPSHSTTSGQTIGIGVASGKVWMCKIKPDEV